MKNLDVKVVLGRGYISPFEIQNLNEGVVFTERDKTAFVLVENVVYAECFIKISKGKLKVKVCNLVNNLEEIHRPHNRNNLEMLQYNIIAGSKKMSYQKINNIKKDDVLDFEVMCTENNDLYCFIEVLSQTIAKGLTVFLKDEEEDSMLGVLVDEIYPVFDLSWSKPDFSGFVISPEKEGYDIFSYDFSIPDVFDRDDLYSFYEISELCCRSINMMLDNQMMVKTDVVDQILYSEVDLNNKNTKIYAVDLGNKMTTIDFDFNIQNKSNYDIMCDNFPFAWINSLKNQFNIDLNKKMKKSMNDKDDMCLFFKIIFKDSDDYIDIIMNANKFFEYL